MQRTIIFIDGNTCERKIDFWDSYASQIPKDSAMYFGKNLDAFNDALTAGGPGFPGDCLIKIIGVNKLRGLFGAQFDFIIKLLSEADFVELIIEKDT